MAIIGIEAGKKGSFQAIPEPPGSVVAPGHIPTWSTDSVHAVVTPSVDGRTCDVAVDAAAPVGTFLLTVQVNRTDGVAAAGQVAVPILPFVPPPPPEVSGFSIEQTA